jgi:hypothetical protein
MLEAKARVTNPSASYKDSWMMENNNASNMFNNNNNVCENYFRGDSSNTIVTRQHDKTMNTTSRNSSNIDHLILCLTLPPSMGESTYTKTRYFSTTLQGSSTSQIEIRVTPGYQQLVMCEYPRNLRPKFSRTVHLSWSDLHCCRPFGTRCLNQDAQYGELF